MCVSVCVCVLVCVCVCVHVWAYVSLGVWVCACRNPLSISSVEGYGRRWYQSLLLTSNARLTYLDLPPNLDDRENMGHHILRLQSRRPLGNLLFICVNMVEPYGRDGINKPLVFFGFFWFFS